MNTQTKMEHAEERVFFDPKSITRVVSLSGGKDSTCMLLMMLERGMPIDAVLHAETGMDFPEMEDHIKKLDALLFKERGIHITRLRNPKGFEWYMFQEPKTKKSSIQNRIEKGLPLFGNGWPGPRVRWCTGQLKTHLLHKEQTRLKQMGELEVYIGIAADEAWRCKNDHYPLVEWGITEKEALQYCYDHGFDFGGLYEIYPRVSCWCCPFQRIDSLRKLRIHHPNLWAQLLDLDERVREQFGDSPLGMFKGKWTVQALDERFAHEEQKHSRKR